ncbi:MAG TPA: Cof-type HAD-IIB family hydrolase [Candidatus Binatia bacterium]|nr:Cof-type HAD-IIB family hydrolase [Candidatus Binatia bacterium]
MATAPNRPSAPIKLVIADVDGTLVTSGKELTQRSIDAVKKLREAGIKFVITSGRPPRGSKMLIEPLQLTEPIGGFNGGVIVTPGLQTLGVRLIAADTARLVLQFLVKHRLTVFLYTDIDWFVRDAKAPHVAREQYTVQFAPTVVNDFEPFIDKTVKLVGVTDEVELAKRCEKELQEMAGDRVSAALSQPYYLDITNPEANKGHVAELACKHYGIQPENIVTIGDMPNDVLMFEKSGTSIAMGQASADVKKAATYVTASNDDEGFAKAIEQFVLGARHEAIAHGGRA